MADIQRYVYDMQVKFMLGQASLDDDWDSYVAEYKRLGGIDVAQSLLEKYNQMYGKESVLADYE